MGKPFKPIYQGAAVLFLISGYFFTGWDIEAHSEETGESTEGQPESGEYIDDKIQDEPTFDIEYSEPPELTKIVRPEYPESAKKAGIEGDVVLLVYIDENGKVRNAIVQSSPGLVCLKENAIKAAYKCEFEPAKYKGERVGVWYTMIMEFYDKSLTYKDINSDYQPTEDTKRNEDN